MLDRLEQDGCNVRIVEGQLFVSKKDNKKLKQKRDSYTKDKFPDVKLQAGSKKEQLEAHKDLLVEEIPYFKAMFSNNFQESSQELVDLGEDVDFEAVSKLILFVYKGVLQVASIDVQAVFEVADRWGMTSITNICSSFMVRELDASNCIDLLHLAQMHSCEKLVESCLTMISHLFQAVSFTSSFHESPAETLSLILQLENINAGPLGEEFILGAVMRWYQHDHVGRRESLPQVLRHVKMCLISDSVKESFMKHPAVECLYDVRERFGCKIKEQERIYNQHFMVLCGYLHSRTGPTCPRTSAVEKFDSAKAKFIQLRCLPETPSYGKAFNLMGKVVYVAVTVDKNAATNKSSQSSAVWTYNPVVDKWNTSTELFSKEALGHIVKCLVEGGTVVHCPLKNIIYAVLVDESVQIDVQCYNGDIFCDKKAILPSLQTKLNPGHRGFQGLTHDGNLYIMGGFYGPEMERTYSSIVLKLSGDGTAWETRADMLISRSDFAVVSFGNKIIVSGGYSGRRHQTCECYSAELDQWHMLPSMKQSRSHHCSVVANNKIYVIGGKSYASQKLSDGESWYAGDARIVSDFVEVLDPLLLSSGSAAWERLARMSKSRCHFSTVLL